MKEVNEYVRSCQSLHNPELQYLIATSDLKPRKMPEESAKSRLSRASNPIPDSFFSELITANHILHHHSIVDAYGHISARNPQNPSTFFLSGSIAPALVSSRSSIIEYNMSDGSPVSAPEGTKHYLERFIHSALYAAYRDVQSVIHAHAAPVLPYSITSIPLRPVYHMAACIGPQAPVFDISLHYSTIATSSEPQDLLIRTPALGTALAGAFSPGTVLSRTKNFIQNIYSRPAEHAPPLPSHPVVLMRGHGFTCTGTSVREAVFRAVHTVANAGVQSQAMAMQGAWNVSMLGEQVAGIHVKNGNGGASGSKGEGIKYLSEREVKDAAESIGGTAGRAWGLWERDVQGTGIYVNEYLQDEEKEEEGGEEEAEEE